MATLVRVLVPLPYRSCPEVKVVWPVPPYPTVTVPRVMAPPPERTVCAVHESGAVHVSDEVATPYTPAAPFETRRLLDAGWLVVARPQYVHVPLPPTKAPKVDGILAGNPEVANDEVATFAN